MKPITFHAGVEVQRTDHRLKGVAQERQALPAPHAVLAAAEQNGLPQAKLAREFRQLLCADQNRAQPCQLALVHFREAPVQPGGAQEIQRRVPEELEALVVLEHVGVLIDIRAVDQGAPQQAGVAEDQTGLPGELILLHGLVLGPRELGGR
jgi:hypothetical protein